ncbi:bactofilin family protein [Butyrivibrio sp. AE3003]|uniref:bactofilin family protein n=1 Tax=Butyrivibrio sp. AE3003 TaxID=1496721 RepID=UPI00068C8CEE|nr:polymer-forming cytoskeletal protein [Butyrivibrio sp. AE3003]
MFGNTKKDSTNATDNEILEQVGTIIGPGAVIDGPLTTKDSTRIDGTIKGNVNISGALIVGQEGKIFGTASGVNIYVAGEVNGNLSAPQGKVEISDTGKVVGDVICKGIIIDENAIFQGRCEMTGLERNSADIAKERAAAVTSDAENDSESETNESDEKKVI